MPIGAFRAAGTGLFPLSLGLLLMVLASIFLLTLQVQASHQAQHDAGSREAPESFGQMLLFLGAIILATLLLDPLGYPLSALLLLVALLRILGSTEWRMNLVISSVTTVVAYLVFVHWLKIPLPMGWLGR
jgi:putative tricarboxylic transport membrane protein